MLVVLLLATGLAVVVASQARAAGAPILGTVFRDYNSNGIRDANEPYVGGVTVTAFDEAGNSVSTSTPIGTYSLDVSSLQGTRFRVEFTNPHGHLYPGPMGGQNRSSVQFVDAGGIADFALHNPAEYCQANPELACNLFMGAAATGDDKGLVVFPENSGTTSTASNAGVDNPPATNLASVFQLGPVYGLAWDARSREILAGAFAKRHTGYPGGPNNNGPDMIYAVDRDTGAIRPLVQIEAGNDFHQYGAAAQRDPNFWDQVGKTAWGDLDLSEDGSVLYAANQNDRRIWALDLVRDAAGAPHVSAQRPIDLAPIAAGCAGGAASADWVPGGVLAHDGFVYFSVTCTAQSTQNRNDLRGIIGRYNPADGSLVTAATFPLNYPRGQLASGITANFRPWVGTEQSIGTDSRFGVFPQPWVLDMEVDEQGRMVVGVADRAAHQFGSDENAIGVQKAGLSAGDTIVLNPTSPTSWDAGPNDDLLNSEQSPATGAPENGEISLGSLAHRAGTGRIAANAFDPAPLYEGPNLHAGGVIWMSLANGSRVRSYELENRADNPFRFGKAGGVGDLEYLCDLAPLQVGNRVWLDVDGDGIQDPSEPPIGGVTVRLYRTDGSLVGEQQTGPLGTYLFTVDPRVEYVIRLDHTADHTTGPLAGLDATTPNAATGQGDVRDSDGVVGDQLNRNLPFPEVRIGTGGPGENDHSFDFGFTPAVPAIQVAKEVCQPDAGGCDPGADPGTDGWVESAVVPPGDTVAWRVTVTNTGQVPLVNVAVADDLAADCARTIGSLAVGASRSYTCFSTGVVEGFENVAEASGEDDDGTVVTDEDPAEVAVAAIEVQKEVCEPGGGCDPDAEPGTDGWVESAQVPSGDTVTWRITVTNTGDVTLTDVAVTDDQAADCARSIGTLQAGESESYTCFSTGVDESFENVAEVTGTPPAGPPVTDEDPADVVVEGVPAIDVVKEVCDDGDACDPDAAPGTGGWVDLASIPEGSDATWRITVTNTGGVDLSNVTVDDALAGDCDNTVGDLAVGESSTYTCESANVTTGFVNLAIATGEPPSGPPVDDNDPAEVTVEPGVPGIDIDKEVCPDGQTCDLDAEPASGGWVESTTIPEGSTAAWRIVVTNTGEVDLSNVTVTDPLASDCDADVGDLAVGESTAYACESTDVTVGFVNLAAVTADPPTGPPIGDDDPAEVLVEPATPAIDIQKEVCSDGDACDPDAALGEDGWVESTTIDSGSTATWRITVTNTGEVDLSNVTVTDPLASDCDADVGDLAVGEDTSYTCESTGVIDGFQNVAEVTGDPPSGPPVTDEDPAEVLVEGEPAIAIVKEVCDDGDACDPDAALGEDGWVESTTIDSGSTATWRITVTNTGEVDLTDVTVTDPLAGDCAADVGDLAVGEDTSYTCESTDVTEGFENVAAVTGTPPSGPPVTDEDPADVVVPGEPGIAVQKEVCDDGDACDPDADVGTGGWVEAATVPPGSTVTWRITVTNIGEVDLTDVLVTDTLATDCDEAVGDLAAGESTSYTCESTDVTAGFENVAAVTGTPPSGPPVTDDDPAEVDVEPGEAALEIQKEVCSDGDACDEDAALGEGGWVESTTVDSGADATWRIIVTNAGEVDLTNVTVTDDLAEDCDNTIGDLAAGESHTYTCSSDDVTEGFVNLAAVTGEPPTGPTLSDDDPAEVLVEDAIPGINITKEVCEPGGACDPDAELGTDGWVEVATVPAGATVTWRIIVTNTGETPLADVRVTDELATDCEAVIGDLAAGESDSYTCTSADVTEGFVNIAEVTGEPPTGPTLSDDDPAEVRVEVVGTPAIDVQKLVEHPPGSGEFIEADDTDGLAGEYTVGQPVTWRIVVTNIGGLELRNVTVADEVAPECDLEVGTLAIGASHTYECTAQAGYDGDTTNVAVATGDPYDDDGEPAGDPVDDDDPAEIVVATEIPLIPIAGSTAGALALAALAVLAGIFLFGGLRRRRHHTPPH